MVVWHVLSRLPLFELKARRDGLLSNSRETFANIQHNISYTLTCHARRRHEHGMLLPSESPTNYLQQYREMGNLDKLGARNFPGLHGAPNAL